MKEKKIEANRLSWEVKKLNRLYNDVLNSFSYNVPSRFFRPGMRLPVPGFFEKCTAVPIFPLYRTAVFRYNKSNYAKITK